MSTNPTRKITKTCAWRLIAAVSLPAVIAACAATRSDYAIDPNNLRTSENLNCIDVNDPIVFSEKRGMLGIAWIFRFEKGPYWSEKTDGRGTFYRAPRGGVAILSSTDAKPTNTADGGFYIPNNPTDQAVVYRYYSSGMVPPQPSPDEIKCSTLRVAEDPSTKKMDIVSVAALSAVAGAGGGLLGRRMAGGGISYGQAAGAGAAGGLIGGAIIATAINADIGKMWMIPIENRTFADKLQAIAKTRVPIKPLEKATPTGP